MQLISALSCLLLLVPVAFAAERRIYLHLLRWNGVQCYQMFKRIPTQGELSFDEIVATLAQRGQVLCRNHVIAAYSNGSILVSDDGEANSTRSCAYHELPQETQIRLFTGPGCLADTHPVPFTLKEDKNTAIGLLNISSRTCYMNTFIQILYHIPEFIERLRYYSTNLGTQVNPETVEGSLLTVFELMDDNALDKRSTVPHKNLWKFLQNLNQARPHADLIEYQGHRAGLYQMDSLEVLQFLLEHLNDCLTTHTNPILGSVFDSLFKISIEHTVTSHISGTVNAAVMHHNIGLDLYPPQDITDDDILPLSLMLELAFNPMETFDDDRDMLATTATRTLKSLPPYLLIGINRADARLNRLGFEVELPMRGLDLTDMITPGNLKDRLPYIYDLKAMALHWGKNSEGGHYTCALECHDGWRHIDDSTVKRKGKEIDSLEDGLVPERFRTHVAYVLYRRRL